MHYVYILYSEKHDKYYIGQTADLQTRFLFHNELAQNSFTSRYRPWVIACAITVDNAGIATRMERYIKKRKSKSYIQKLVVEEKARQKLVNRFQDQEG
jgi:putative endonuclease